MSQNQNNRTWLGSIAAAIKALMGFIMGVVDVANEGVAMADIAVKSAREKQAIDLTISMADYANQALTKASMQSAHDQEVLNEYVAKDSTGARKKNVEEAHDRLKKLVEAELARIKADRIS